MYAIELDHSYSLHLHERKGFSGQDLIAILRPDGTLAHLSNAPPPWVSWACMHGACLGAVHLDLLMIAEEEKRESW